MLYTYLGMYEMCVRVSKRDVEKVFGEQAWRWLEKGGGTSTEFLSVGCWR